MAQTNNFAWYHRYCTPTTFWRDSFTYFDADLQVESVNNEVARPVAKYNISPGGNNDTLEKLIWLIAENRDQGLLLLHQYQQGNNMSHIIIIIWVSNRYSLWILSYDVKLGCHCHR